MRNAEHSPAAPSAQNRSPPATRRSGANGPPRRRSSPIPCRADCAGPSPHVALQARQSEISGQHPEVPQPNLKLPQASTAVSHGLPTGTVGPPCVFCTRCSPEPARPGRKHRCPTFRGGLEQNWYGQSSGRFAKARSANNTLPTSGQGVKRAIPNFCHDHFSLKPLPQKIPKGRVTDRVAK